MKVMDATWIDVLSIATTTYKGIVAGVLWPKDYHQIDEVKGYIYTGATKTIYFGDKPCENMQIEGTLFPDKFKMYPHTSQEAHGWYTYNLVTFVHGKSVYNTLPYIAQEIVGQDVLLPIGWYATGKPSYSALRIESCDNDVVVWRGIGFTGPVTEEEALRRLSEAPLRWTRRKDYPPPSGRINWIPLKEETDASLRYLPWARRISEQSMRDLLSVMKFGTPEIQKGDLCMEAVQGTRAININTLMYTKELFETFSLIKSTIGSVVDLAHGNPKTIAKEIANLYLSYHYGYRLSIRDTKELMSVCKREIRSLRRAQAATRSMLKYQHEYPHPSSLAEHVAQIEHHCKVWYGQLDSSLSRALNDLFRWDIFPELGNVYDMIPYSFVVDWFIPFGDILDKIDYHTYSYTLDVYSVEYSEKITVPGLPVDIPFFQGMFQGYTSPGLTLRYFHRWMEPELAYPPLELKLQAGPKNWIPAGALILQRI